MTAVDRHGDLVLAADPHVGRDDPDLAGFLAWLAARAGDAGTVVLLGDLFSLWLGLDRWTGPHHRAVLDACADLRREGVRVVLVEGNRELWAAPWEGRAFDVVTRRWEARTGDGRRWTFVHGDLLDREDRVNLLFQAIVRSRVTRALFRALPAGVAPRVGRRLERALRRRCPRRREAPAEERLGAWARALARTGADAAAIGHLHLERHREPAGAGEADLWLVPDWRARRRHLRILPSGEARYEDGGPPPPPRPRILAVRAEPAGELTLELDPPLALPEGAPVAVDGGGGPEVRRGRVVASGAGGCRLRVHLEEGPPARPGDTLHLPGDIPSREGPEERTDGS